MLLAETHLGNVNEQAALSERVVAAQQQGQCLTVSIGRGDRIKGRILAQTADGQSVGIVKGRDWLLQDGDVLETAQGQLVLVSIQGQQVMVLRFDSGADNRAIDLMHLGHMLGNHHWPITSAGGAIYVELVAGAEVMAATVREMAQTLGLQGLKMTFEERTVHNAVAFSSGGHHHHHHA